MGITFAEFASHFQVVVNTANLALVIIMYLRHRNFESMVREQIQEIERERNVERAFEMEREVDEAEKKSLENRDTGESRAAGGD